MRANRYMYLHLGEKLVHRKSCKVIPQDNNEKYLSMHLDRKLTWQKHIWTKRKQLDGMLQSLNWLLGRQSQLKPNSKMLMYRPL